MEDEVVNAQAEGSTAPGEGAPPEGQGPLPGEGDGAEAPAPEDEVARLREGLALATAKYRALLLHAHPEVPEELVTGDTVEAVDASFLSAQEVVDKVRSRLEARLAAEPRIGAGAPPRGAADLSALSPREKIALALGRRQS
jgi:hypothetical protein